MPKKFILIFLISLYCFTLTAQSKLVSFEEKGKFGFKDKVSSKKVVEAIYDVIGTFSEGMCPVRIAYSWGYINERGTQVIPCKYQDAHNFKQGLACVRLCDDNRLAKECKFGFIDKTGRTVIFFQFDDARDFSNSLAGVQIDNPGPWAYIDKSGNCVISPKFEVANSFHRNVAVVKLKDKFGVVNNSGQYIIPCEYNYVSESNSGIFQAVKSGKISFIDINGKTIVPADVYCKVNRNFENGLAIVEKKGVPDKANITVIDSTGKEIVPVGKYVTIDHFTQQGLAAVSIQIENPDPKAYTNTKVFRYGFINRTGKEIIPCIYELVEDFKTDQVRVKKNGKFFYINSKGICIKDCP